MTLDVTVSDTRTTKDKVGRKKNGFGMETAGIISKDDVPALVSQAITQELRNRGFIINDGGAKVELELTKFMNDFKLGFFSGSAAGEVSYTVQVKKPDGNIVYAKAVIGLCTEDPIFLALGHNAKKSLENALKDATTKLMQDEAFIQALMQTKG